LGHVHNLVDVLDLRHLHVLLYNADHWHMPLHFHRDVDVAVNVLELRHLNLSVDVLDNVHVPM